MIARHLQNVIKIAATTVGIISVTGLSASAGVLTQGTKINTFLECLNDGVGLVVGQNPSDASGWQYAFDSAKDGMNGNNGVGGANNPYEVYGMAVKETSDSLIVALNANTLLSGTPEQGATGGQIGWGDLFFNFSGKNFESAMNSGDLFGIRFAEANASGVQKLGLYSGVIAKTVTDIKEGYTVGFGGLSGHEQQATQFGGTPSLGDLSRDYFSQTFNLNEISTGKFLTGISFLATGSVTQELVNTGYNAKKFDGSQTIAFKFDKSELPGAKSVPEPSSLAGLAAIALVFAGTQLRKRSVIAK